MRRLIMAACFVATVPAAAASAAPLCTVIAEARTGRIVVQQGDCARRVTPASTFKIALSLMGYDSGYLIDEHRPALPFVAGYADWIDAWKTVVDPSYWMTYSVVWYSQQLTQRMGERRFRDYVQSFHYGNEDVSGDPGKHNGLQRAWLSSSLQISPLEQLVFLRKLLDRKLPVKAKAYEMTNLLTELDSMPGGWNVHGKTGTASPVGADGALDVDHSYGWFVGWISKGERRYVFARLAMVSQPEAARAGPAVHDSLLGELPTLLGPGE